MYNYNKAITGLAVFYLLLFLSFWCVIGIRWGNENVNRNIQSVKVKESRSILNSSQALKKSLQDIRLLRVEFSNDIEVEEEAFDTVNAPLADEETDTGSDVERKQIREERNYTVLEITEKTASRQRVVDYNVLERKEYLYHLEEEDLEALCRIVEAEAGSEDENGRLLVANVVLNRLNNEYFPDTVKEVVLQTSDGVSQFSPVSNGMYYKVTISEETQNAVERALMGEDISKGALFFVARRYADSEKMRWFDENLTRLFAYGGHEFYSF